MKTSTKWILGVVLVGGIATVIATRLITNHGQPRGPQGPKMKEVAVELGSFRLEVTANGVVKPIDRIELKSKASGEIVELNVEAGDQVPEGTLIATLDQEDERAALEQARANLDIARAELALATRNHQRRSELFSSEIIAEEERDQSELDLAVARGKLVQATTELERAEERMSDSVITAPVSGIILQKYVERGQIIASGVSNVGGGSPIADIADMSAVHIEAGIDEIDVGKIHTGLKATIRAEAYPDKFYAGGVVRIAPEARIEQNVTLFDVIIEVQNTDGKLKSGMNASVEILIIERPDVLTVPATAISRGVGDEPATVLVKTGQGFQRWPVLTGMTDYRVTEIVDGLSEGDVIGIPMVSRLSAENDQLSQRIRSSRGFGNRAGGHQGGRPRGGQNGGQEGSRQRPRPQGG